MFRSTSLAAIVEFVKKDNSLALSKDAGDGTATFEAHMGAVGRAVGNVRHNNALRALTQIVIKILEMND